jgi:hypothetical protein
MPLAVHFAEREASGVFGYILLGMRVARRIDP